MSFTHTLSVGTPATFVAPLTGNPLLPTATGFSFLFDATDSFRVALLPDVALLDLGGMRVPYDEALVLEGQIFQLFRSERSGTEFWYSVTPQGAFGPGTTIGAFGDGYRLEDQILAAQYPSEIYKSTFVQWVVTPRTGSTRIGSGVFEDVITATSRFRWDVGVTPFAIPVPGDSNDNPGRFLVAWDTPNGQRSAAWGGWLDVIGLGGTEPEPPAPPPEVPDVVTWQSTLDPGGVSGSAVSRAYRTDPATGAWWVADLGAGPGVLSTPLPAGYSELDRGWLMGATAEAFREGVVGGLRDAAYDLIDRVGQATGIGRLAAIAESAETSAGLRDAVTGWLTAKFDLINAVDRPDFDLRAFEREQREADLTLQRDLLGLVSEPLSRLFTAMRIVESNSDVFYTAVAGARSVTTAGHRDIILGGDTGDMIAAGAANDFVAGFAGNDSLSGEGGNDTLAGGDGIDTLVGGPGDDVFYLTAGLDRVVEVAGGGRDHAIASVSVTLAPEVEDVTLIGSAALAANGNAMANRMVGNAGANRLNGGGGADTLDGGLGADTLTGGPGNDLYILDSQADRVVETAGGGRDRILATVSLTMPAEVEDLSLAGTRALVANGNGLANLMAGTGGANRLNGGAGNDTLLGLAGNDTLDGGPGVDSLVGGPGDDSFILDSLLDRVVEQAGGGRDRILAGISLTLPAEVEDLSLTGARAINGYGTASANVITGNAAANRLFGGLGDDTLDGGAGADTLEGGLGADRMIGGAGNDVFLAFANDVVVEGPGGGIDEVRTSSPVYILGASIENLTATGTAGQRLTGNVLGNLIRGADGADTLIGAAGADTLIGGAGGDSLLGGDGNDSLLGAGGDGPFSGSSDTVRGGAGDDVISGGRGLAGALLYGEAGRDTITAEGYGSILEGGDGDDVLIGASVAFRFDNFFAYSPDKLVGGAGNDLLEGGLGADWLEGGTGADTFSYAPGHAEDGVVSGANGIDTIVDFDRAGGDRIDLSRIDADVLRGGDQAFAELLPTGAAAPIAAGSLRYVLTAGGTVIEGSTDADPDMEIRLFVRLPGYVPVATDFVL